MRVCVLSCLFWFVYLRCIGQDCNITAKANSITPDKLCSPVSASWSVSYTGVNNFGKQVEIQFNWDDGNVEILPAAETEYPILMPQSIGSDLAGQGIYAWKVIGRYADGTYFTKVGDVTFLH